MNAKPRKKKKPRQRGPKWVCPTHAEKMESRSTQFGVRYQCPVDGCTVAGWQGGTSTPADDATRAARIEAHAAFDPLWQVPRNAGEKGVRTRLYRALAEYMGLAMADCHIGMFNVAQCSQVMAFVAAAKGGGA